MKRSFGKLVALSGLVAAAAVGLPGCIRMHHAHHLHGGQPFVVAARLDCPQSLGWLNRISASSDGNNCEYRRDDGEQVSLIRLPLNGQSPEAALSPIETSLKTLLPPRHDTSPAPSSGPAGNDSDSARVDVPGVHIDAHGDKAEVRVMGVTINADNHKSNIHAGLGSDRTVVSADETGAEVRNTDVNGVNADLVLILASERPGPTGFRSVGYMARGPAAGPLVVAAFKCTDRHTSANDDHDIRRLLERNLSR